MKAEYLIKFLGRLIKSAKKKLYLILDDLRMHHAKAVKAWVTKRPSRILKYFKSFKSFKISYAT